MATQTPTPEIHIPGHGLFEINPRLMDAAIERFLPASICGLRDRLSDISGRPASDWNDVGTVTELLAILIAEGALPSFCYDDAQVRVTESRTRTRMVFPDGLTDRCRQPTSRGDLDTTK